VPEFIDPVFAKTIPKCSFSMTEKERSGLVFVKTGSINSGTGRAILSPSRYEYRIGLSLESSASFQSLGNVNIGRCSW
jgi:hypothetical protein